MKKRNNHNQSSTTISTDPQKARQIIMQERAVRIQSCQREINAILEKHKCRLDVFVILRAGQVIPQVEVVTIE